MFGLKPEVMTLFTPFFRYADGQVLFYYGETDVESWTPRLHRLPSTLELWLASAGHHNLVTDLYISHSAAELFCFASQRSFNFSKYPEQVAFAAVGLLPAAEQVNALKTAFPFARWHLLFSPDLLGRIADAAVASWFKARSVDFRVRNDQVVISYCGKHFVLNCQNFSLNRFECITDLRTGMRTHKPPRGLPSFIELQLPNNDP
jgi:hypothetical protein